MWSASCPVLGIWPINTHSDTWHVFFLRSDPSLYNERRKIIGSSTRVEAESNTSTVTLRVVGDDEKGSLKYETWSRVPSDSDPRKTALAKASSIYKWQTHPLVREGAQQNQDRNCQRVKNIWSWAPDGARHQDLLTDCPSVAIWLWLELGVQFVSVSCRYEIAKGV
jgi:hypothetical protein